MTDNGAKAPTDASTSPMGNTKGTTPTPLARGIGENVAAKLRSDHPEQNKRMREHLAKKKTQSGHAHE